MAQIAALKTHICNYARTRDVFAGNKKSRFKEQYRAAHETEILLHETAKRAFDALSVNCRPSPRCKPSTRLAEKKKALYADYTRLKEEAANWRPSSRMLTGCFPLPRTNRGGSGDQSDNRCNYI